MFEKFEELKQRLQVKLGLSQPEIESLSLDDVVFQEQPRWEVYIPGDVADACGRILDLTPEFHKILCEVLSFRSKLSLGSSPDSPLFPS